MDFIPIYKGLGNMRDQRIQATGALAIFVCQLFCQLVLPCFPVAADAAEADDAPAAPAKVIEFEAHEVKPQPAKFVSLPVSPAVDLPVAQVLQILKRFPSMTDVEKPKTFALPGTPVALPPQERKNLSIEFPPVNKEPRRPNESPAGKIEPLRVLRVSHTGAVGEVREFAIEFSQPMVPVTDVSTVDDISRLPLKM
ncbi:MAG TPA: hypothetical protein V6C72_15235, partial [Chroococcales cyanobacterium]